MVEVGNKLLGRFADCLAGELGSSDAGTGTGTGTGTDTGSAGVAADVAAATTGTSAPLARPATAPTASPSPRPAPSPTPIRRADGEAIDLIDTAGLPVLKRLAPVLVGVLALLVLWRLVSRRR
jgi:hypothetical protein